MRFYLIDRVTELIPGTRATGIKSVSLSDEILHDHFPGYPIMPGVLILESAAQLAGFLLEMGQEPLDDGNVLRALLVQVEKAKFHNLAEPGDLLEIQTEVTSHLGGAAQVRANVHASGRRVARADLMFTMKRIDVPEIHEQRKRIYKIWTRNIDLSVPIR